MSEKESAAEGLGLLALCFSKNILNLLLDSAKWRLAKTVSSLFRTALMSRAFTTLGSLCIFTSISLGIFSVSDVISVERNSFWMSTLTFLILGTVCLLFSNYLTHPKRVAALFDAETQKTTQNQGFSTAPELLSLITTLVEAKRDSHRSKANQEKMEEALSLLAEISHRQDQEDAHETGPRQSESPIAGSA